MGPYCKFCDRRCFCFFPDATPKYVLKAYRTGTTIIATCGGGQDFEMGKLGYCYDKILKEIEICANHKCAVCHGSLDTDQAPIADNDGYGKTIYIHPDCHPENQGIAEIDQAGVPTPNNNLGVEYYDGKRKPHRAYYDVNGTKTYVGYFTKESDAWQAAISALDQFVTK